MMELRLCAGLVVLHTHCRYLFATCTCMSSEKENDDSNQVLSKKHKPSLSRKGKGRLSSVSEHQLTVSRILSGENDNYEPKSENKPDPCHLIPKQESSSTAPFPGIQYNNCTV